MRGSERLPTTTVVEPALLITINQTYRPDMSPLELYEATRGFWRVGERRDGAHYAFAVYEGVVREVYGIRAWFPAGTLVYQTRKVGANRGSGRMEFEGEVAHEIRNRYVGRFIGKGGQNPIRYVNVPKP
jgi:hypothetical protein